MSTTTKSKKAKVMDKLMPQGREIIDCPVCHTNGVAMIHHNRKLWHCFRCEANGPWPRLQSAGAIRIQFTAITDASGRLWPTLQHADDTKTIWRVIDEDGSLAATVTVDAKPGTSIDYDILSR